MSRKMEIPDQRPGASRQLSWLPLPSHAIHAPVPALPWHSPALVVPRLDWWNMPGSLGSWKGKFNNISFEQLQLLMQPFVPVLLFVHHHASAGQQVLKNYQHLGIEAPAENGRMKPSYHVFWVW